MAGTVGIVDQMEAESFVEVGIGAQRAIGLGDALHFGGEIVAAPEKKVMVGRKRRIFQRILGRRVRHGEFSRTRRSCRAS